MDNIKRVALYIRVSTEEQALHGDSIRTQTEALEQYSKDNNFIIVDKYVDEGYSATNLKRPNLQRMLEDIKENKIDLILLTKIDRFSRGVKNFYKIMETLEKHKCDWKTILENYDSSTAAGRLHINIMLSVAENEAAQTSERIKFVFQDKLKRKEIVSGSNPFGYKIVDKHLVIDEEKAEIVKECFNSYEKFTSMIRALQHINSSFNTNFSYNFVYRILKNNIYVGTYIHNDLVVENFCDAIISSEQFNIVQKLLSKNTKVYNNKYLNSLGMQYIFSGMVICQCGRKMSGTYSLSTDKRIYKYYRCHVSQTSKKCDNTKRLSEKKIEIFLLKNVRTELEKIAFKYDSNNKKIKSKNNNQLKSKIKKQITKLQDLYFDDLIDKEDYKLKYQKLNMQLIELENNKSEEKNSIINLQAIRSFLEINFEEIYTDLNDQEKRTLWTSIIDTIVIDENKNLTIKFL
ncbi:recombinase family protein [Clostridioides difficile]|uniref:recombinase family protein n=1 Tax=Clostridioides difficile TaxID=1496 RepID=UPI0021C65ADD|nr:recombinase family protein [Clostridioides difficile]UWD42759.1 recombinase family protein [Clostridioides difficile]